MAVIVWMLLALAVALTHTWVPESTWLLIHLVGLGIITHSIMVWSAYFTRALLKVRGGDDDREREGRRLGALALGTAAVLIGVPLVQWWLVALGAAVVSGAVAAHVRWMVRSLRASLPARFAVSVRYYTAAGILLPVGAAFGAALAFGLGEAAHARLLVAHTMTMLLGWVGLSVVGTLVTFWPTALRTRMDPRSGEFARRALPILLAGLAVVVAGSLAGMRVAAAAGLAVYAAGLILWGRTLVSALRRTRVREFAPASMGAAMLWFCAALLLTGAAVLGLDDARLAEVYPTLGGVWAVGFLLQLVMGAMARLLPTVLGGGPRVVKAASEPFERGASLRLTIINLGLLIWLLPLPPWVRIAVSTAVLAALACYLPLTVLGIRAGVRAKREAMAGSCEDSARSGRRSAAGRASGLGAAGSAAGIAVLALAVGLGLGVQDRLEGPAAGAPETAAGVEPTGETVRAEVAARDMHYFPSSVEAQAGDRVVIELTNEDAANVHDLRIGGQTTPRLSEGESAEIDLGVVGQSLTGECTVVGHAQMGMTFEVEVEGGEDSGPSAQSGAADPEAGVGAVPSSGPSTRPLRGAGRRRCTGSGSRSPSSRSRWPPGSGRSAGPSTGSRSGPRCADGWATGSRSPWSTTARWGTRSTSTPATSPRTPPCAPSRRARSWSTSSPPSAPVPGSTTARRRRSPPTSPAGCTAR